MKNFTSHHSSPSIWIYFGLVFVLSIPFWLLGMAANIQKDIPINLPISALMFVCPMIAALILVYQKDRTQGVKDLCRKILRIKIERKSWYIPVFLSMPLIMIISYGVMKSLLPSAPPLSFPPLTVVGLFLLFFVPGLCEEIGWQGYVYDKLENRWNAWTASVMLGVIWQVWHVIPHLQTDHSAMWIVWQCASSVLLRVLIVWVYKNTDKNIIAAVIVHTMNNVCSFLLPNYDSSYATFSVFLVTALVVMLITFLWGKTLTQYRFHSKA
ncbi:type II CAAX endopeptidase family protein [Paenibacillus favisporus]|uniref:CPBP family intramembrane glutamic endopeptidase n=1 Tax=Paenibacillus favisporus TaxID=221028 RepID=UPI002DB86978|nr:type II CAAX endopeptidase family protein [Paenibacillus favisporus]MEC0174541.1 type II CAAX endopeptidase family protein [Paenibacillus favisporus]